MPANSTFPWKNWWDLLRVKEGKEKRERTLPAEGLGALGLGKADWGGVARTKKHQTHLLHALSPKPSKYGGEKTDGGNSDEVSTAKSTN